MSNLTIHVNVFVIGMYNILKLIRNTIIMILIIILDTERNIIYFSKSNEFEIFRFKLRKIQLSILRYKFFLIFNPRTFNICYCNK